MNYSVFCLGPEWNGPCGYCNKSHYSYYSDACPNDGSNHNSDYNSYNDIRSNNPSNEDAMGASNEDSIRNTKVNAILYSSA